MVKRYRTVSTRIEEELFNRFLDVCESRNCKPNTMLKNYVEDVVKNDGKRGMEDVESSDRQSNEGIHTDNPIPEETGLPWG